MNAWEALMWWLLVFIVLVGDSSSMSCYNSDPVWVITVPFWPSQKQCWFCKALQQWEEVRGSSPIGMTINETSKCHLMMHLSVKFPWLLRDEQTRVSYPFYICMFLYRREECRYRKQRVDEPGARCIWLWLHWPSGWRRGGWRVQSVSIKRFSYSHTFT